MALGLKIPLIILFIFQLNLLCSQENFSYGIKASGQFSNTILREDVTNGFFAEQGKVGLGYSFGLNFRRYYGDDVYISLGASYRKLNHKIRVDNFLFDFGNGVTSGLEVSQIESTFEFTSYEVPFVLGIWNAFPNDKYRYLFGATLIYREVIELQEIHSMTGPVENEPHFREFAEVEKAGIFSLGILGGIDCHLNDKVYLSLQANINFTPNQFRNTFGSTYTTFFEGNLSLSLMMKNYKN